MQYIGQDPICVPTTDNFQEVLPAVLPLFHIYGFTGLMISKMSVGAKIVTLPEFNPKTFINSITEHKATLLKIVPPIRKFRNINHKQYMESWGFNLSNFPIVIYLANEKTVSANDLSTVRTVMSGAAPLGALDVERFQIK